MSRDLDADPRPIEDRSQLLDYFRQGNKPVDQRGIGTEHEKFVVRASNDSMLSFDEPGGYADIYRRLIDRFDWRADALDRGQIVSVVHPERGAVTLEPGGQFELSGAVTGTIFETAEEFDRHLREVRQVADDDLRFAIWGLNPGVSPRDVPWMPKSRYDVMRRYLATRGKMAHWMMKTTCTIQANFDYVSEADAVDLVHTAVLASPVIGALFANSPIQNGDDTEFQSRRNFIWWRHTDPDRTGIPSFMYTTDWGWDDYLEYVLDVPMFFIRRGGEYIDFAGHSFRRFIDEGHGEYQATMGDFELHLSTLFPDVRIKQFVEVRSADGGPREAVFALPAIWKGLLYDEAARRRVRDLFDPLSERDHRKLIEQCYRDGIHGDSPYGPIAELADAVLEAAEAGLDRIADGADHDSERAFLAPLKQRLADRKSWADILRDDFQRLDGDLVALAEEWSL